MGRPVKALSFNQPPTSGMMIDASIVITENIYRNVSETWKEGESLETVALRGATQIGVPPPPKRSARILCPPTEGRKPRLRGA